MLNGCHVGDVAIWLTTLSTRAHTAQAFCFSCAPTAISFEDNTGHLELGAFRNLLKAAGVVGSTFSQLDVDLLFTKVRPCARLGCVERASDLGSYVRNCRRGGQMSP